MEEEVRITKDYAAVLFFALVKKYGGWVSGFNTHGNGLNDKSGFPDRFIAGFETINGGIAAELPLYLWSYLHGVEVISRAKMEPDSMAVISSKFTKIFHDTAMLDQDNKD